MRESPFIQECLDEGRREGRRASILAVLSARLGTEAAAEFTEPINHLQSLDQLSELLLTAAKCRGVAGFRQALGRLLS